MLVRLVPARRRRAGCRWVAALASVLLLCSWSCWWGLPFCGGVGSLHLNLQAVLLQRKESR